jgi:hypothetical protein
VKHRQGEVAWVFFVYVYNSMYVSAPAVQVCIVVECRETGFLQDSVQCGCLSERLRGLANHNGLGGLQRTHGGRMSLTWCRLFFPSLSEAIVAIAVRDTVAVCCVLCQCVERPIFQQAEREVSHVLSAARRTVLYHGCSFVKILARALCAALLAEMLCCQCCRQLHRSANSEQYGEQTDVHCMMTAALDA